MLSFFAEIQYAGSYNIFCHIHIKPPLITSLLSYGLIEPMKIRFYSLSYRVTSFDFVRSYALFSSCIRLCCKNLIAI